MNNCGCKIYPVRDINRLTNWEIGYCPLHQAAEELLQKTEEYLFLIENEKSAPATIALLKALISRAKKGA